MLSDGTGNKTRFKFVKERMQEISGLMASTNYTVTVQAFTVGLGPAASITVMAAAISNYYFQYLVYIYYYWIFLI